MNRNRKLLFTLLGVVLLFVVAFAILALFTINECNKLQEVPSIPIYPEAVLLESNNNTLRNDYSLLASMAGIRSRSSLVSRDYSSDGSDQNIIDFYESHAADCQENFEVASRVVCTGRAMPFGTYLVYIDADSDLSSPGTFTLEIRWFACGSPEEI